MQLKTNIMCGSCIQKVTPVFNEELGEGKWSVDTNDPRKVLTVTSPDLSKQKILSAVAKAGYKAEELA